MRNRWLAIGALNGLLAVAAGAFGAHALKSTLSAESLDTFKTGAFYHLVHAVALCVSSLAVAGERGASSAKICFLAGIVLFSGSLYALALTGVRELGAITPLGGIAFIAGWGFLAWTGLKPTDRERAS